MTEKQWRDNQRWSSITRSHILESWVSDRFTFFDNKGGPITSSFPPLMLKPPSPAPADHTPWWIWSASKPPRTPRDYEQHSACKLARWRNSRSWNRPLDPTSGRKMCVSGYWSTASVSCRCDSPRTSGTAGDPKLLGRGRWRWGGRWARGWGTRTRHWFDRRATRRPR